MNRTGATLRRAPTKRETYDLLRMPPDSLTAVAAVTKVEERESVHAQKQVVPVNQETPIYRTGCQTRPDRMLPAQLARIELYGLIGEHFSGAGLVDTWQRSHQSHARDRDGSHGQNKQGVV